MSQTIPKTLQYAVAIAVTNLSLACSDHGGGWGHGGSGGKGSGGTSSASGGTSSNPDAGVSGTGGSAPGDDASASGGTSNMPDSGSTDGGCSEEPHDLSLEFGYGLTSGQAFAVLPAGINLDHLEIDLVQHDPMSSSARVFPLPRLESCTQGVIGYARAANTSSYSLQICTPFPAPQVTYRYIEHCNSFPPKTDGGGSGFCVRDVQYEVRARYEDGKCLLDLPPDADRTLPVIATTSIGMTPQTSYLYDAPDGCEPDGSLVSGSWASFSGSTIRICSTLPGDLCASAFVYTVPLQCK